MRGLLPVRLRRLEKKNPIPPTRPRWSVYGKLAEENQRYLWGILRDARPTRARPQPPSSRRSATTSPPAWTRRAIEKLGAKPLAAGARRASTALKSTSADLPRCSAALHLRRQHDGLLFGFGSDQDFDDATQVIAVAWSPAASGCPDRDYYLKDRREVEGDPRASTSRTSRGCCELLGDDADGREGDAGDGDGASRPRSPRASLTRVERRDPYKLVPQDDTRPSCRSSRPAFDWKTYLAAIGASPTPTRSTSPSPKFFQAIERRAEATAARRLEDATCAGTWSTAAAPYLSTRLRRRELRFLRPRRCAA